MLSIREHATVEEASTALLPFVLHPKNWLSLERISRANKRPGDNPAYQRRVGNLRICASIDVSEKLEVFLRIGFRSPELSPMKAADHLETFLKGHLPLLPNTEWQVQIDGRRWIHFVRRYI